MNADKTKSLTRNGTDDLIRVISIIFVIMIHTAGNPWSDVPVLDAIVTTIIFFSNSFFFMLSGKYNISKQFNNPKDYAVYYKKKFVDILFPYILVSVMISVGTLLVRQDFGTDAIPMPVYYINQSIKDLLINNNMTHFWFMFYLLGFIISAPFLSKMMNSMSDAEMNILFFMCMLYNFVAVLVFPFLKISFLYHGWFLDGWITHFFMGYYIYRVLKKQKNRQLKWLYVGAITGFILNVIGMTYVTDRFSNPTDIAPTFTLACVGVMAFLENNVTITNEYVLQLISFLAKNTFVAFMVHFVITFKITPYITAKLPPYLSYFGSVMVTAVLSFIVSYFMGIIIINPCKIWLRKLLKIA